MQVARRLKAPKHSYHAMVGMLTGEDIDGGELVHLAHDLELADVEAVEADELARTARGQAEPEGLVFSGGVGDHQPGRRRRNGRRFGQALGTFTQSVCHQVLLHPVDLAMENPWSPSRSAYWRQPMVGENTARVNRASMTWVGVVSGIWGLRRLLGINASSP